MNAVKRRETTADALQSYLLSKCSTLWIAEKRETNYSKSDLCLLCMLITMLFFSNIVFIL